MSTPYDATLRLLAARWRDAGVLLPAFRLLALGRPLTVKEIARACAASEEQISSALATSRCERDTEGRVLDLYGLTLLPTVHRLEIGHRTLFSCCALWAHVVPKVVDATVRVESVDPYSREIVKLSISPEGVETARPQQSAATLAVASREAIEADVCRAFCCQVRHFVTRESAEAFAAAAPNCHPVELPELQGAADRLYDAILDAGRIRRVAPTGTDSSGTH